MGEISGVNKNKQTWGERSEFLDCGWSSVYLKVGRKEGAGCGNTTGTEDVIMALEVRIHGVASKSINLETAEL